MSFVLKVNKTFIAGYDKENDLGVAVLNVYNLLSENGNFQNLVKMYDQFKITGVRAKTNVVDVSKVSGVLGNKMINIITAWDRTGISEEKARFYNSVNVQIPAVDYGITNAIKYDLRVGKGITDVSSHKKSILNSTQRWTSYNNLYPTTVEEKGCYIATSNCKQFDSGIDLNSGKYSINDLCRKTPADLINDSNPCNPLESSSCKWKPTFLVGCFSSGWASGNQLEELSSCDAIVFNSEFSISVTFRGLKAS
eukprot:jgi/Orpsp1_1/1180902/evm.model.c7180000075074.1